MTTTVQTIFSGQGEFPIHFREILTTDSLATITAAGYLNKLMSANGYTFTLRDLLFVNYASGSFGLFILTEDANGVFTMHLTGNTNVALPTIANHLAVFTDTIGTLGEDVGTAIQGGNIQAGLSGTAGYLASFPSTGAKGSFRFAAVANTGDTVTTFSNVAMGQATTVSVSDPGASTGYVNTSTVNASTTPVGAFITKDVALTAAGLASAGHITIQAGSGSMRFKVRNVWVRYSAAGLSGGGGDRLVQITDGTTVYNNAGITAALLGTPVNTVWGGSGNPLPGTVDMATATAAGATLYAVYAGGTTDFTTGTVNITVALERTA